MKLFIFLFTNLEITASLDIEEIREASLDDLMNGVVKRTLKIDNTWGKQQALVFSVLRADFMRPATAIGKKNKLLREIKTLTVFKNNY